MICIIRGAHNSIVNLNKVSFVNMDETMITLFFLDSNTKKEVEFLDQSEAQECFSQIIETMQHKKGFFK